MIKVTPTAQTVIFGGTAALDIFAYPIAGETIAGYNVNWGDGANETYYTSSASATLGHAYNDIIYNYTSVYVSWFDTQTGGASTTVDVNVIADPAALVPNCGCSGTGDLINGAPAAEGNPAPMADKAVRFADGVTQVTASDLGSAGFGVPWGQTRSWSNGPAYSAGGVNGNGWSDAQLPYVSFATPPGVSESIVVLTGGSAGRYYDWVNGTNWQPRYFDESALVYNATAQEYVLTDESGAQFHFYGFYDADGNPSGTPIPALRQGKLKSYVDPDGNVTSVTAFTADGQIAEVQRATALGGSTVTESYLYSYTAADVLQNVTLRRQVNGGAWTIARQVQYTYDGAGNLQTAAVEDASTNTLDTYYYRYYVPGDSNTHGYVGGMKYVFNPQSYARLVAALGSNVGSLTDAQVAPYADNYFEYDATSHAATKGVAQGDGGTSGGGLGTTTFAYTASANASGFNSWAMKTVETLSDGTTNTVYTNYAGEVMLTATTTGGQTWLTFNEYDTSGRQILSAHPSAVTGYNDSYADLLNNQGGSYQYLNSSSGLIELTNYATTTTATSSTAGDVAGYVQNHQVEQGQSGTPITTDSQQYIAHADANGNTIYPVASTTRYRYTNGTGQETTTYTYTFFSGTNQVQSEAVSAPVVGSGQNGPGTADVTTTFNDGYGRPIWTKDPDGFLTYTAYDQATGAVVKTITDVNTANTGDFTNLPSGWSTPSGGGLNLVAQLVVDALGRTTQLTDPNGNVTYAVYLDTSYEVRVYPGWNSATNTPTGPTQDYREDRPGSYFETLTMTATPHLTNGAPDGTEAISGLQTLARTYTDAAGQAVRSDAYFNLAGVTWSTAANLGTLNTNYYETAYAYDTAGRPSDTTTPTGTLYHTDYDGLDRVIDDKVGTSLSNLVTTTAYVYDNDTLGGGTQVGDGNLTQVITSPGGGAASRVEQLYYDWRDRLVADKGGVQSSEDTTTHRPIVYTTYDNLGEVTQVRQYDGDGVTLTSTGGVPNAPAASLLRAQENISYDDQGRVYQAQTYDVNPSTGAVSSNALTTNFWYDHRGDTIKTSEPGGLVIKAKYDGAGRPTVVYTTDGLGDSTWADANSVTTNNVLEQLEYAYDANGNVIQTTDRQRFHDETATGALGNPSTGPKARVYYAAAYYDAVDRVTAAVDVGTNGGTAWVRPASVPARSDTVLVTSTAYNAAGWVDTTTDPRGLVEKDFYDNLGRTTKAVAAYDGGSETSSTNVPTEFTYDGMSHVTAVQADLPGGGYQQTKYVYGVTTAGGSGVNSNDLLAAVQHPDPATGNASSGQQDSYRVNALGQVVQATDRNGNVHAYTYDVLGRLTSDAVTTLGAGVDGTVRRIDTAYDTQGNPYLFTSYSDTAGTTVVNQVQRAFNGLGQLVTEWQSHSGAVNTSTTPKVQYAYTELAGGANHSRLTSMTYPNGRVLNYNYASGVDDRISRLTSLSDTSATLESYSYLGRGTVVQRAHPQSGVNLTYISPTGGTGVAGDKYVGLDPFGRVADQNWYNPTTSTSTDRFQYSYDRDSNRLTRTNVVNTSFSETYGYDTLNQLTSFSRGSHSISWNLDAEGNWSTVTTDGTPANRTHNAQNEITSGASPTTPTAIPPPTAPARRSSTTPGTAWSR